METDLPAAKKSHKKLWIILGSILLLLVIIGSFGSSGSNTSAKATNAKASTTTTVARNSRKSNVIVTSTSGSVVASTPMTAATGLIIAGSKLTGSAPAFGSCHFRTSANGQLLPDQTCTPGAVDAVVTQSNIGSTICKSGYTGTVRPPESQTNEFKTSDMAAYSASGIGELDHLVPLELGGSSDAHNLWFEPGKIPNLKDNTENALHSAVCHGQIQLSEAQLLIATDWTTVLNKTAPPTSITTIPTSTTDTTTIPTSTTDTTTIAPVPVVGTNVVHAGSFCSTEGATGVTSTGKPEVCKTSATDSRLRWRAA